MGYTLAEKVGEVGEVGVAEVKPVDDMVPAAPFGSARKVLYGKR
jgi:hypothetical protein